MLDLRGSLPRAKWSIGQRDASPLGATLHYNGPPVSAFGYPGIEVAQLKADARYHMRPGGAFGDTGADGIQYHYAVLSDGTVCQLRDETAILWHCANTVGNRQHLAIHLPLGGAQRPTDAQWLCATRLFDELMARYEWHSRATILGHREWPRSDGKPQKSCPGPIVFRSLQLWRGQLSPATTVTRYRVTVDVALIREGPGQQFKVALGGTARMHRGDLLYADASVIGKPPAGSTNPNWLHRADQVGFVHSSVLEPAP